MEFIDKNFHDQTYHYTYCYIVSINGLTTSTISKYLIEHYIGPVFICRLK